MKNHYASCNQKLTSKSVFLKESIDSEEDRIISFMYRTLWRKKMCAIEHYWENLNLLVEDISLYAQIHYRTRTRNMGREGETSMMASNSNHERVSGKRWSLKATSLKLWSAETSNDLNHRPQEFMIDQVSRSNIPSQKILLEGASAGSSIRVDVQVRILRLSGHAAYSSCLSVAHWQGR